MTDEEIDNIFTYHAPNGYSVNRLEDIRNAAKIFAKILNELVPDCADKSAAVRKLRECVMTANAAIVLNQDSFTNKKD